MSESTPMQRVVELVSELALNEPTEASLAELQQLLQDENNRRLYIELTSLQNQLETLHTRRAAEHLDGQGDSEEILAMLQHAEDAAPEVVVQLPSVERPRTNQPKSADRSELTLHDTVSAATYLLKHSLKPKVVATLATAAALLLGVVLAIVLLSGPEQGTPIAEGPGQDGSMLDTPSVKPVVATLTAERDALWDRRPGDELFAGQRFTLTRGFAEITTQRGAVAVIQAPATIELLDSANAILLHAGKLVGICETESSKGFLVRTPQLDITDLGTRFGVAIDPEGNTLAEVFDGRIAVKPTSHGPAEAIELAMGESVSLDPFGRRMSPERFGAGTFAELQAQSQPAITLAGQVRWSTNVFASQLPEQWPRDHRAMLVEELRGHTLQSDITLTHHEPGTYQSFKADGSTTIPAGTTIRSYLVIHASDEADEWNSTIQASIVFDGEVLGIIANDKDWKGFVRSTQAQAGVLKPNPRMYLESLGPDHSPQSADLVEIKPDKRTLAFRVLTSKQGADVFRVIVREPAETNTP